MGGPAPGGAGSPVTAPEPPSRRVHHGVTILSGQLACEDRADVGMGAVGGIGARGPALEGGQGDTGFRELSDALVDLGEVSGDQAGHMLAGGMAAVTNGQDGADLGQCEPSCLGMADE
jgi:hypothetical protein